MRLKKNVFAQHILQQKLRWPTSSQRHWTGDNLNAYSASWALATYMLQRGGMLELAVNLESSSTGLSARN